MNYSSGYISRFQKLTILRKRREGRDLGDDDGGKHRYFGPCQKISLQEQRESTSWQDGSWIMYEHSLKDYPCLLSAMMVMSCQLRKHDRTTEKRKGKLKATVGDCDDTAVQSKAKKKIPRKTDDKLVAADSISTSASMSLHDVMDDPYSFKNEPSMFDQRHLELFREQQFALP
ncbi:hypothetical protein TB2_002562 [Malus domestica]